MLKIKPPYIEARSPGPAEVEEESTEDACVEAALGYEAEGFLRGLGVQGLGV